MIFFYGFKEYDKSWADIHKVEELGGGKAIFPKFLEDLKKASGREK
jgi:hypothetical protein